MSKAIKTIKTWLDCDPGIDDAFAIVMCAFADNIDLIGISNVSGNHTIDKLTINTLKVKKNIYIHMRNKVN